jgi:L-ascorbate metabolism protein UlaG (beta-lactamase superfamily)
VLRGTATPGCSTVGIDNETTVPTASVCTAPLRPGGSRTVRRAGASAAVRFASVMAIHANGIPSALLETPGVSPGTTAYGGAESGFVVRFTNGLSVYLSGDTGMFGDMESIIARYYKPQLVILNMGDVFGIGPDEAAFSLKFLVRPRTVMPSHANEQSSSEGRLVRGSKVDRMASQISGLVDVVLPLSGVTRMFDGEGRCVGCQ